MNVRITLFALLLCASVATPACAASHAKPAVVDDALAFVEVDRHKAALLLEGALASAKRSDRAILSLYAGEQRRLLGEQGPARKHFKAASKGSADVSDSARLGLALLDPTSDRSKAAFEEISDKAVLDTQNADRYLHLTVAYSAAGDTKAAAKSARSALQWASSDDQVKERVRAALQQLADGGEAPAPPEDTAPDLRQKLEKAIAEKNTSRAKSLAAELASGAEAGSDAAVVASYVDRRLAAVPVRSETIGVLLPLTGKYKGAGAQIKAALELGYGHNQGRRRLIVVDAGPDAASCIAALESLVLEQGVVAVVGPLRSDIAPKVTQVAHALAVPLLGLHKAVGTTEGRPWVLEGIATPQAEVEALVNYVMKERHMKSFAVFSPDSPYGHRASDAFMAEVIANGGSITVAKYYDSKSMDVIASAKELGRKDYEARAQEYRDIKRAIDEAGGDPRRSVLPPVIDFDAIFVPDNHRRIPVAVGGLAYEEFPIGQFRVVKDGPTVPLLGLSGWNHPNLITSGGPYVRDSIFTDVFVPFASAAFVESYSDKTNREPNTLEAQTYAVGQVLAAAANSQASTRTEFRQALLDAHTEATTTGATGIQTGARRVSHTVKMLSVNKDEIFLIPPTTPETEAPAPQ